MPLAVELRGVSFRYGDGPLVLREVDLAIERGELVAIAGPNGGGKTTLVRIVLGLERPTEGQALLFDEPAYRFSRRATLGYLAQRAQVQLDAPATVEEVVSAGRLAAGG
ncbi:MAG TPA: ATP-binding cassette domain-containing protein, partial [Gaiellaceae bacterium]|nr:ATP-binding cassette domain-containing protein [Gaiellaceae bacterium]